MQELRKHGFMVTCSWVQCNCSTIHNCAEVTNQTLNINTFEAELLKKSHNMQVVNDNCECTYTKIQKTITTHKYSNIREPLQILYNKLNYGTCCLIQGPDNFSGVFVVDSKNKLLCLILKSQFRASMYHSRFGVLYPLRMVINLYLYGVSPKS